MLDARLLTFIGNNSACNMYGMFPKPTAYNILKLRTPIMGNSHRDFMISEFTSSDVSKKKYIPTRVKEIATPNVDMNRSILLPKYLQRNVAVIPGK